MGVDGKKALAYFCTDAEKALAYFDWADATGHPGHYRLSGLLAAQEL